MTTYKELPDFVTAIRESKISIYDKIDRGNKNIWIPSEILEDILNISLKGTSLEGFPLRSRSKFVKSKICDALGYDIPKIFKKEKPRFPGQDFDVYVQKSNNLQVWNQEIIPTRRYVVVKVTADDLIETVKVVTGEVLAEYDTTKTLTRKFQARLSIKSSAASDKIEDTSILKPLLANFRNFNIDFIKKPSDYPEMGNVLPISIVKKKVEYILKQTIKNIGSDQERLRGGELHKLVCKILGYSSFSDTGKFPDIRHQLIEIKLQTSPTIDLGLISPESKEPLDIPTINGVPIRHCDVRYLIIYGMEKKGIVTFNDIHLIPGEIFFAHFTKFGGLVSNKKYQLRLPDNFFA